MMDGDGMSRSWTLADACNNNSRTSIEIIKRWVDGARQGGPLRPRQANLRIVRRLGEASGRGVRHAAAGNPDAVDVGRASIGPMFYWVGGAVACLFLSWQSLVLV